jgi:hypothetical protein
VRRLRPLPGRQPIPARISRQLAWLIGRRARLVRPRALFPIALTVALGISLASCGNQGIGLARQACGHVGHSIALLHQADRAQESANAAELEHKAYIELLAALPIAAEATYVDNQWQALMTTLSQSSQVAEVRLVPALEAECRVANRSVFNQAPPPSSVPPPSIPPPSIPPPSVPPTSTR